MPRLEPTAFLPLAPATFYILVALADDERHGYAIRQFVEEESEGRVKLGPGTLYPALKRLLNDGLIEELDERADGEERRRYYRISTLGRAVAVAEARRLEAAVRFAGSVRLIRPKLA